MSWSEILNHKPALERFRRTMQRGRLASTYLFVGPPGIGKRTFALKLAEALLCESESSAPLEPCGACPACQQVRAQSHPDLILISRPKDKAYIPVETFIGDREHRRQIGLCHDIGLKSFRGGRKIAIIDDADFLNAESANSLLKTLEEPPPGSLLILIGTSQQRQLATIVSRSQVVRFNPLQPEHVEQLLARYELPEDSPTVADLASASEGSIELAMELSDINAYGFRMDLFSQLATGDPGSANFAKSVTTFVESTGKDAAQKRRRLIRVADLAISFFRTVITRAAGSGESVPDRALIEQADRRIASSGLSDDAESINQICSVASLSIERTMNLQRHVASNVNAANAVAAWLTDLGRISRGVSVPALGML